MFWWFTRCLYSQELEDTIESLRQQISVLQSRARVLQEELDSGNQFSSSFSISAVRDQDELWSNWRKKITSNKYITEWSAGFLWSRTRHYCLTFESEKNIYIQALYIFQAKSLFNIVSRSSFCTCGCEGPGNKPFACDTEIHLYCFI